MSLEMDVDIVPVIEGLQNRARGRLICIDQVAQGLIGKHHTPAEGIVGAIALNHDDLVAGVLFFHQQPEVQTRRAAADTNYSHESIFLNLYRCNLPVSVRGSALQNAMARGYL